MNRSRMLQNVLSYKPFPYPENGLVSYWRLDEDPAIHNSAINDSIGDANGTLITNDGSVNKSASGKVDRAINFDGVDDYVEISANSSLELTSVTVCAWVFVEEYSGGQPDEAIIFEKTIGGGVNTSYLILIDGSRLIGRVIIGGQNRSVIEQTDFVLNQWQHVAFTYDETSGDLITYRQGNQVASGSFSGAIDTGSGISTIGEYNQLKGRSTFNGSIDDILIYNRALSPSEIQQIYNYGA